MLLWNDAYFTSYVYEFLPIRYFYSNAWSNRNENKEEKLQREKKKGEDFDLFRFFSTLIFLFSF